MSCVSSCCTCRICYYCIVGVAACCNFSCFEVITLRTVASLFTLFGTCGFSGLCPCTHSVSGGGNYFCVRMSTAVLTSIGLNTCRCTSRSSCYYALTVRVIGCGNCCVCCVITSLAGLVCIPTNRGTSRSLCFVRNDCVASCINGNFFTAELLATFCTVNNFVIASFFCTCGGFIIFFFSRALGVSLCRDYLCVAVFAVSTYVRCRTCFCTGSIFFTVQLVVVSRSFCYNVVSIRISTGATSIGCITVLGAGGRSYNFGVIVTECRNFFLSFNNCITNRTLSTLSKSCFSTGCCLTGNYFFDVAESRYFNSLFDCCSTYRTMRAGSKAGSCASGRSDFINNLYFVSESEKSINVAVTTFTSVSLFTLSSTIGSSCQIR